MANGENAIKELEKKKREWDLVAVVGVFFSILAIMIFVLQIRAFGARNISKDATFVLKDVKTIDTVTGNGGYKTTFYYEVKFVDKNGNQRTGLYEETNYWDVRLLEKYSEKLSEVTNNPPYENGEKATIGYGKGFKDGDKVSVNVKPTKSLIFLGGVAALCCTIAVVAICEASKLNKEVSEVKFSGSKNEM